MPARTLNDFFAGFFMAISEPILRARTRKEFWTPIYSAFVKRQYQTHARRAPLPTGRQARTMKIPFVLISYAMRYALCAMRFSN